ncbi:hypothetical protein [Algoriphagus jejuensis]
MEDLILRKANSDDSDALWELIEPIIRAGDTYVFFPILPEKRC